MNYSFQPLVKHFYLMAKPIGYVCNLNCSYCYYLEKEQLYPADKLRWEMTDNMLEDFIVQYIHLQKAPSVLFTWHGGEPALRGLDFFQKVVSLQKKHAAGRQIENSLQTNGTTLTDDFCRFFKDHRFLIGISIDGPEFCHDRYRVYRNGQPSFAKTMKGIELLKKHQVEFNTLSVVNDFNSKFPLEVYRFLKEAGSHYMQFTPVVERINRPEPQAGQNLRAECGVKETQVAPFSVNPVDYGNFLISIFDEWIKTDVGEYFVITFDCILANRAGVEPALCIFAPECGNAGVVEFNGDVYSCDHFVFPEYRLGNISDKSVLTLMNSDTQTRFGRNKRETLPGLCRECRFLRLCNGECPKNRISFTPQGEPGLNYLCEGLKHFYGHVEPYMDFMVNELRNERAVSNVMKWAAGRNKVL